MARPKNTVETESMTISVTPQLKYYLEVLAVDGFYGGGSSQDVAKFLLNNAVQELIIKGLLTKAKFNAKGDGKVELVSQPSS